MKREEDQLQVATAKYLRMQYPSLIAWHTPNGGRRNAREAARFAGMGVRPGVPDWTFILPSGLAAFVELKSAAGRQTETQRAFMAAAGQCGCPYVVCRNLGEFMAALTIWKREGLLADPSLPFDVRSSIGVRSRGILNDVPVPWAGLLRTLARHLDVHPDPQWYTERDAADLEAMARVVRERVEAGRDERLRAAADRPAPEMNTSASGRG